mgnify:CR=1 FL=1
MIAILLICAYIEHLIIFWYYSLIWSIKNQIVLYNCKHSPLTVATYAIKIQLTVLPPLGCIFYYFYSQLGTDVIYALPQFNKGELYQWMFMLLWEEIIFYHVHRILHHPKLYHIHKLHHTWTRPVPWEALYSSIPENIIINFFPVLSAPYIVSLNIYYLYIWVALATITSVISHSNFNMSHTAHHKYFNVNFGTTRFFDIIYGTNRW